MARLFLLLIALSALCPATAAETQTVPLRLSADEQAPIIIQIPATHAAILSSAPVTDPRLQTSDWRWTEHTTRINGYIETKFLSKNFNVMLDTFVRAQPRESATVLTIIKPDDRLEIVASNDKWTTIRFNKALLFYFKQPQPSAAVATVAAAPAKAVKAAPTRDVAAQPQQPTVTILPAEPLITATKSKPKTATPAVQPQVAARTPAKTIQPAAPIAGSTPAAKAPPVAAAPVPVVKAPLPLQSIVLGSPTATADSEDLELAASRKILRISGILTSETLPAGGHFLKLLQPDSGDLLTYIDASRLPIQNYTPYIDRKVHLFGELRQFMPQRDELLLLAYTLRPAE